MKKIIFIISVVLVSANAFAQPSFVDYQKNFPRVADAMRNKLDTLKKQFATAGLHWPASEIYIRSFKYDSELEVWVRNNEDETFKLFKTFGYLVVSFHTFGTKCACKGTYFVGFK